MRSCAGILESHMGLDFIPRKPGSQWRVSEQANPVFLGGQLSRLETQHRLHPKQAQQYFIALIFFSVTSHPHSYPIRYTSPNLTGSPRNSSSLLITESSQLFPQAGVMDKYPLCLSSIRSLTQHTIIISSCSLVSLETDPERRG